MSTEEAKSSLGKSYFVVRTPEEYLAKKKAETETPPKAPEDKHPFTIAVDWPQTDGWVEVEDPVRTITGITRYALFPQEGKFYSWVLWFTNTEHYDYQFTNTGGETFGNNTYANGDHYIQMDPDVTPMKIIQVKGD